MSSRKPNRLKAKYASSPRQIGLYHYKNGSKPDVPSVATRRMVSTTGRFSTSRMAHPLVLFENSHVGRETQEKPALRFVGPVPRRRGFNDLSGLMRW